MKNVKAYGTNSATTPLSLIKIDRREVNPEDVLIEILYSGICHSDIHTARSEWGPAKYPCVPGHEIVGKIIQIGKKVKKFKLGDEVGVGVFVDACEKCINCKSFEEHHCLKGTTFTYNSPERSGSGYTLGGYSSHIVIKQRYVFKIKKGLPLEKVAPLLCAGITTYSPLKKYKVKKGDKVGVIGLGGLGHMAVKLAKAMGAEVTVFSTSSNKEFDAKKLGAKHFIMTKNPENFSKIQNTMDLIIDTVSADHEFTPYVNTLKRHGVLVLVGLPPNPIKILPFSLITQKVITGSVIGGTKETQEMLAFCAKKKVFAEVELIKANQINEAYENVIKGLVKYRYVIDAKSF